MTALALMSFNRGFIVILAIWANVGGLIAAVAVTAAAQLWEFDYPRVLLLNIGIRCGLVALNFELWASCARSILPEKEFAGRGLEIFSQSRLCRSSALRLSPQLS